LKGDVSMRFHSGRLVLAASALFILSGALARAQTGTTDESKRKVKTRVTPLNKIDRKSTRLNSSHVSISYAVFCLKKKNAGPPDLDQRLAELGPRHRRRPCNWSHRSRTQDRPGARDEPPIRGATARRAWIRDTLLV